MSEPERLTTPNEALEPPQIARWWAVDLFLAAFLAGTALLVLVFSERIPGAIWVALGHLAALALYLALKRAASRSHRLRLLYLFSPYAVVVSIFEALGFIIPHLRAEAVESSWGDALLAHADLALFGSDPTRWFEGLFGPVGTTVLQICYTSYYFLPLLLGLVLVRRRRFRTAITFSGVLVGCFLTTYIGYYLVPAYGPRLFFEYDAPLPTSDLSAWIYRTIDALDNIGLNAFPSGHTAVTLLCLALLARVSRRLALLAAPVCFGLVVSTVALRYHYLVDVLAGLVVTAAWMFAGLPAVSRFDARGTARDGAAHPLPGNLRASNENLPPSG